MKTPYLIIVVCFSLSLVILIISPFGVGYLSKYVPQTEWNGLHTNSQRVVFFRINGARHIPCPFNYINRPVVTRAHPFTMFHKTVFLELQCTIYL